MNNLFSLNLLSQDFYNDYPHSFYPEMESKESRPFLVFIIKIDDHNFTIPFITNIKQRYSTLPKHCFNIINFLLTI